MLRKPILDPARLLESNVALFASAMAAIFRSIAREPGAAGVAGTQPQRVR